MNVHPCSIKGHHINHHATGRIGLAGQCEYRRKYLGLSNGTSGKHVWETHQQAIQRVKKTKAKGKKTVITHQDILNCPLGERNSAKAKAVGDYLTKLVVRVLQEADDFSGKRPFGDSDWYWELVTPVAERFQISDEEAAGRIVEAAESLFKGAAA